MKVYNWQGLRSECPTSPNGSQQTHEVVAAKSGAELMRLIGCSRYFFNEWVAEGGNDAVEAMALSEPGTIFWQPINTPWAKRDVYVRDGAPWTE